MNVITLEMLRNIEMIRYRKVWKRQLIIFRETYGERMNITLANVQKAINTKNASAVIRILELFLGKSAEAKYMKTTEKDWKKFNKISRAAQKKYVNATKTAWDRFDKIQDTAWEKYEKDLANSWDVYAKSETDIDLAMKVYLEDKAVAWEEYKKITSIGRKEFDKTARPARADRKKVLGPAHKEYLIAIAPALVKALREDTLWP